MCRFTPVRFQFVQFHDRKQKNGETVYKYAQDLESLFYKAYPHSKKEMKQLRVWEGISFSILVPIKPKVAGTKGGFEELMIKHRFKGLSYVTWAKEAQ